MKRYRKLFYLIPAFAVMIFVGCSNKGRSSENVDYGMTSAYQEERLIIESIKQSHLGETFL